jgi:DNA-binding GntR family transcriptional regulator
VLLTPADMAEIYEMRILLEVPAIGKIAEAGRLS